MPVITLASGIWCGDDPIERALVDATGYERITDREVVAEAARLSGLSESKVGRALDGRVSVFDSFTHEQARAIAHMRLAVAGLLDGAEDLLLIGFTGLLIPREVTHALRVCLIANLQFRVGVAAKDGGLDEKAAVASIKAADEGRSKWVNALFGSDDPWDASLFDIVIPTDKTSAEEAVALILDQIAGDAVLPSNASRRAVGDFGLAARVQTALVGEGHSVDVKAAGGEVTLTINQHSLMLRRLEEELRALAGAVDGVESVKTEVGPGYHKSDIYRRQDFLVPSKVLLVDDEREFVQALSERLMMRDLGSAVAFDGESALNLIRDDEPEVMILDLKMPGIDGIEVLRRVKETQPEIEVIVLTGHGSEADREECMRLGAFAYLRKPVDIDTLTRTIGEANEKIRRAKERGFQVD
ncbi:MAG: response regulator [Deltaproteobacteria bacterium]|nr:response regulator [Deltaproteobacteria bacterium]